MTADEKLAFISRVLRAFRDSGADTEDLWWRVDGEYAPVTFWVKCSDLFYWGSADCEDLTPENIGELEQAIEDCRSAGEFKERYAGTVFCCRIRKMRPQGACYKAYPQEIWPLLDACGPLRETGHGNPHKHPLEAAR